MPELHLLSPAGFVAAGVHAGIKQRQVPDVGLLLCTRSANAAVAFTTNRVVSPAVQIGRRHIADGRLRGVVVNSGNANACTGRQGERDARRMCAIAASIAGCGVNEILPSSTGIIGHFLPMQRIERGIVEAGQYLGDSREHAELFADAILTTDLKRKMAATRLRIDGRWVHVAGVCKGSGMIGPRLAVDRPGAAAKRPLHATMLAYLTTDAQISAGRLRPLMARATDQSFNAVTVDDQTSTNDTAAILASGASGVKIDSPGSRDRFAAALTEICQSLARQIAADGEGATRLITIRVESASSEPAARAIARSIANSPLVKCAMHGNDPNWGRILVAAGMAGVPFDADRCVLKLQKTAVFRRGRPVDFNPPAVSQSLNAPEVLIHLACNLGTHAATCWTCDLSREYITINADYHT